MTLRRAAFLDRDGTIIEDTGFVRDPAGVVLLHGAAEAIKRLNDAGWVVVVVTNQSGIARGLFTEKEYAAVAARVGEVLAARGARIDATWMCPHHPDVTGACDCRKPGLKHYLAAAERFGIDFTKSVFVGDRLSDVEPARALGGTGILLRATAEGFATAGSLAEAVALSIDN
jgi:D-glycero-D-manno-heptose 1,7-bisphosphate phosphatase